MTPKQQSMPVTPAIAMTVAKEVLGSLKRLRSQEFIIVPCVVTTMRSSLDWPRATEQGYRGGDRHGAFNGGDGFPCKTEVRPPRTLESPRSARQTASLLRYDGTASIAMIASAYVMSRSSAVDRASLERAGQKINPANGLRRRIASMQRDQSRKRIQL